MIKVSPGQATVAAAVKDAVQREMAPMREELDKYKRQLEMLKEIPRNLPLPNQPMAYSLPYMQMPFGTCQYKCQQRKRYPSQSPILFLIFINDITLQGRIQGGSLGSADPPPHKNFS